MNVCRMSWRMRKGVTNQSHRGVTHIPVTGVRHWGGIPEEVCENLLLLLPLWICSWWLVVGLELLLVTDAEEGEKRLCSPITTCDPGKNFRR